MQQADRRLATIGSKSRAEAILSRYPDDKDYKFIILRCRNISSLEPDLIGSIFPQYAHSISWSDVFVFGQPGENYISGIVAIEYDRKKPIPDSKKTSFGVRYGDESIVYSYSISDKNVFRSSLFNFNYTMEYAQEGLRAEAKIQPLTEKSPPATNPRPLDTTKPIASPKPAIVKPKKPKQPKQAKGPEQPPAALSQVKKIKEEPIVKSDIEKSDFVPITSESLGRVVDIMEEFEREGRLVAIVFDRLFNQTDITMAAIRKKFEPLFGKLGDDCVLIKTNINQLMPNLEEAYKKQILFKGQAYFIGAPDLDRKTFITTASQSTVLFGLMTMGCVMLNLKRGAYFVNRGALSTTGSTETVSSVETPRRDIPKDKIASAKMDIHKSGVIKIGNGPASSCCPVYSGECTPISASNIGGDPLGQNEMEEFIRRSDIVTKTMHQLQAFGNAVIRIDNLPANLTVNTFNLIMGTFSLTSDQIIGTIASKSRDKQVMNVRIVIKSDNEDMKRIVSKNKLKTVNGTLLVRRTDLKELETFLHSNYNRLVGLKPDEILPTDGIAYGAEGGTIKECGL